MQVELTADILIVAQSAEPEPPTTPPVAYDNLYRVKEDQYCASWGYKVRQAAFDLGSAPAVNRTGEQSNPANFIRSKFTRPWQFFWADLLSVKVFGVLYNELGTDDAKGIEGVFSGLTKSDKFLTNRFGTDNCNNYISGDMRSEDPLIDPLVCAGSIVRVLDIQNGMAKLWTFKEWEAPPPVTKETLSDPRVLTATNIFPDGHLTNFDNLYIKYPTLSDHSVPYPYISSQTCWIALDNLEKV